MSRSKKFAELLWQAQQSGAPSDLLTSIDADLTIEEAYAIQQINLERRMAEGARLVGRKVGLTSTAIRDWLGVAEPDFGGLLDTMAVPNGGSVPIASLMQPRVEAELAFLLKRPLRGPGVTAAAVLAATDYLLPAIEIIDTRQTDWRFKIQDTIADNASSAMFVLGSTPIDPQAISLRTIGATLRLNGRVVSTGAGAACMGDPVNAVVWLANTLGVLGVTLEAGEVILSGALGPVSPVVAGDYVGATVGRAEEVRVRFT
jgi:2-oxopent-4-enoate/cis-2-oxohex-4-enoate hydratase